MKTMNKSIALAAFFFLAFFALPLAGQTWLDGSLEEAQAQAKATGKILLVDVFVEYG